MLSRPRRIPLGKEAFKGEFSLSSSLFLLKFRKNRIGHHRYGVIISAKTGKTAVFRHFVKRQFFGNVAEWPESSPSHYDFLFITSSHLGTLSRNYLPPLLAKEIGEARNRIFKIQI